MSKLIRRMRTSANSKRRVKTAADAQSICNKMEAVHELFDSQVGIFGPHGQVAKLMDEILAEIQTNYPKFLNNKELKNLIKIVENGDLESELHSGNVAADSMSSDFYNEYVL